MGARRVRTVLQKGVKGDTFSLPKSSGIYGEIDWSIAYRIELKGESLRKKGKIVSSSFDEQKTKPEGSTSPEWGLGSNPAPNLMIVLAFLTTFLILVLFKMIL